MRSTSPAWSRRSASFRALDGLALQVATGEVHGFLGPNGAGKSTTIRVLLGLLRADAGDVRLLGGDPWHDAVALHRRLAYVPGDVNLWPTLSGGEAIDLLGKLRGGLDPARRAELLERFELDPTKKGRAYSKGNRQKVALVAALASDAELLVLDEPTSGLDPLKEAVFQACIEETREHGRTVLLSSHILAEVEALCDRVTIIRAGKTVETGTLSELRHLTRTSISVETEQAPRRPRAAPGHPRPPRRGPPRPLRRRHGPPRRDDPAARRLRRAQPDGHAADARGAVPAPLRRRDRMSALTGAGTLLRFALRRERVRIPVYLLLFTILVAQTAAQSESMFTTRAARADYAATVTGNPGLIAMVGPPYALTNVGGDVAWQIGGFGAAFVALMSMFFVGRHTRGEEQSGRSELIGAAPVGRFAPLTAALIVVTGAQILLGALVALTMIGLDQPSAGSLALGASLTGVGLVFAGVAAVAVQVSQTTSAASGMVGAAIGGAYLLRAAGDVGDGTLSWLSPIGWGQAMRPFAGERWWPLALSLVAASALVGAAFALRARRDEGAGLVEPRPGPATACDGLTTAFGLALRLQRGALLGWSAGLFFSGLSIGLTGRDAKSLIGDSDQLGTILGSSQADIVDQYFAVSMLGMALIGAGFGIQAALRMRGEETAGHLESLLATALSRAPLDGRPTSPSRWAARWSCWGRTGSGPASRTRSTATTRGSCRGCSPPGSRRSPPSGSSSGWRSRCSGWRRARSRPRGGCSAPASC